MTVTGKTLGENLEELRKNGFYEHCDEMLIKQSKLLGRKLTEKILSVHLIMQKEPMEVLLY